MRNELIITFMNEFYSKPPKKNYATKKIEVYHFDDVWSLDLIDLKVYGPKSNRGYRYVLIVIDNFSEFGWYIPLMYKSAQTIKDSFGKFLSVQKENRI